MFKKNRESKDQERDKIEEKQEYNRDNLPPHVLLISKILGAIGEKDNDTTTIGSIHITYGEIKHTIADEDNYYTADFIKKNSQLWHIQQPQ